MKQKKIKLNCDMGESFSVYKLGMDEEIMPFINMVNLACGFHASDPVTMHRNIKQAKANGVEIGAHPTPCLTPKKGTGESQTAPEPGDHQEHPRYSTQTAGRYALCTPRQYRSTGAYSSLAKG